MARLITERGQNSSGRVHFDLKGRALLLKRIAERLRAIDAQIDWNGCCSFI